MAPWSIVLLAFGVSADAFAVSVGKGLQLRKLSVRTTLRLAGTFAAFQMAMPVLGWLIGRQMSSFITAVDHWVAFGLLGAIGGKMIWDALTDHDDPSVHPASALPTRELLMLGVATSIDALAVGLSFAFLSVNILPAVLTIGVITFALSAAGVTIGHHAGARWRDLAQIAGGVVLIGIGFSILGDHLGWW